MGYLFFNYFWICKRQLVVFNKNIMRRLRILFYWLFYCKNNVTLKELLLFLTKPKVDQIAKQFIIKIEKETNHSKVYFKDLERVLFWPNEFPVSGINQVTAETFDKKDWHYYQFEKTQIQNGEILLDIGTAEGLFPLLVFDKCKHIYMVEPSQYFYRSLLKSFGELGKTTLFNCAVGSTNEKVNFNEDSLDGQIAKSADSGRIIDVKTIDSLIEDKTVTFLKADIEGFEIEMLKGAKNTIIKNKPKIAITTYHKPNNPKEIIDLIKSYVPEYNYFIKGIHGEEPKPVMIHFWI